MPLIETIIGCAVSRPIFGFINKISKHIFPFKGSSDEERMLAQQAAAEKQQSDRREFEKKLSAAGLKNARDIAYMTALLNRQTTLQNSIISFQNTLKSRMFDDALRNFPLNIPPLVMLHNSGLSAHTVTGGMLTDDPIVAEAIKEGGAADSPTILDKYKQAMRAHPVALSVFVAPLIIDSRVDQRDKISSIIWDEVYQRTESIFLNEYNRCGERPVIFYPGAWNANARPGMHAAEILYFFTKGMPVVVLEPRYDGKRLRCIFSCWGIGPEPDNHIRQEIIFDIDWNDFVLKPMYQRSLMGLTHLAALKDFPQALAETQRRLQHNVDMYERLAACGALADGSLTDQPTKLFHTVNSDFSHLSREIADSLGICISLIADVHHLSSRGIQPYFPELTDKYFKGAFENMTKPDRSQMRESINMLIKSAYMDLLLDDCSADSDYKSFEKSLQSSFELFDNENTIKAQLEASRIVADNTHADSTERLEIELRNIPEVVDECCRRLNITDAKSMQEKISLIAAADPGAISYIEEICDRQLTTLDEFLGR